MKRRRDNSPHRSSSSNKSSSFQLYLKRFNICWRPSSKNCKMRRMESLCTVRLVFTFLRTLGLVFLYYCFSIGITFYQKWFIKDFHFPFTVVMCHLVVKFIFAAAMRGAYQLYTGKQRIVIDWPIYCKKLAPTGIASALDIGLSNWSFEFISISLYTMTKSTCIIFILGFSILFGLEKKRFSLVTVVVFIALGLFKFTNQSTKLNMEGFLIVLSASFLSGLRWTLAQLIMQRKDIGLSNPLDMIYHIQPWMVIGILPLAVIFEGIPIAATEKVFRYKELNVMLTTLGCIFAGSVIAFLMEMSEYLLLTYTSSLTLSIAGIFKEICTLYLAFKFTGDTMSSLNFFGLILCIIGITVHVVLKALHSNDPEEEQEFEGWQRLLDQVDSDPFDDEEDVIFVNNSRAIAR